MPSPAKAYEVLVTYTVEIEDPDLVLEMAWRRYSLKLTGVREGLTPWHREQWQRWVDDGKADGTGLDVALFEFINKDGGMSDIPGASLRGWSSQQRLQEP